MKRLNKHTKGLLRSTFAFFFMLLVGFGLSSMAQAQVQSNTEAGSVIGNQATLTYLDGAGVERTITSNLVTTTVKQVGSVSVETDQNRFSSPGGQVTYPHTITNYGNGADIFDLTFSQAGDFNMDQILIYADENGDGVADSQTPITVTPELAGGEIFRVVMVGYIPTTAAGDDENTITFTATSQFDNSKNDSVSDVTTVSTNAVISVVKSLDKTSGAAGDQVKVTLTYTNSGNNTATAVQIADALPAGMTYVAGSARWSVTGPSLQLTDADQVAQGTSPQQATFDLDETTTGSVTAIMSQVAAGQRGTLTFDVTAAGNAGVVENTATYLYNDGTGVTAQQSTNTVQFTIEETAAVSGTGETIASATQGSYVDFENVITNNGNATDVFDVTLDNSSFPNGTSLVLYKAGGSATLLDTDSDGIPDTGPLASGASFTVILRATLPTGETGGPYSVDKVITSSNDESVSITLTDILTEITASTVDLTNDAAAGDTGAKGENAYANGDAALNTESVNPGEKALFKLYVTNTSGTADNYDLAASIDETFAALTLPANWTVTFKNSAGGIITNTGVLAAGAKSSEITAEVYVPEGQAAMPAGQSIYFKAESPSTGAKDRKHDAVIVNTKRDIRINPNNSGQAYPGGVVVYQHTVTNNGNVTETNIALVNSDTYNGFSSVLYLDVNKDGILDANDTIVTSLASLTPGQSADLLVKVSAPNGVGMGVNNVTEITATPNAATINGTAASAAVKATDVTSVITSNVVLVKEQSLDNATWTESNIEAEPNEVIYYRLTLRNNGIENVTNADIEDITPARTSYVANSASITTGGVIDSAPAGGTSGTVKATIATITPGQTIQMVFAVTIDP